MENNIIKLENKGKKIMNNKQKKVTKKTVTNIPFNDIFNSYNHTKNLNEEEKNTNNYMNKTYVSSKKFLPTKHLKKINKRYNDLRPIKKKLIQTQKKFDSNDNEESFENELNINNYSKNNDKSDKYFKENNKINQLNHRSKTFHKRLLFSKLKQIIYEIEEEKKKENKKKDISYLFLVRTVKPIIPNLKNRLQLNKYLINDFKENDSYQEYIKRSLKYRNINEQYEMTRSLQKLTNQNSFYNGFQKEDTENDKVTEKLKFRKNTSPKSYSVRTKKKSSSNFLTTKTKSVINNFKPKNFFINNTNSPVNKNKDKENQKKRKVSKHYYSNIIIPFQSNCFDSKTKKKSSSKRILYSNEKEEKDNNSFLGEKMLTDRPKKNKNMKKQNTNNFSEKAMLIKTRINLTNYIKQKQKVPKKKLIIFDKFNMSNNLYNEQKNYFNEYLMNNRVNRSKNFSLQMSNLAKEKDVYNINLEETGHLPRLKEGSLIYEMKFKNLFKNSFNPMAKFKEGDDDLDLDNLKKIKASILETEIEMFSSLKNEINPKYIKSKFNKTTIGKYHSTRGVYFGSK